MPSKREQQEAAGRWLRSARKQRGFHTGDAFARRIGVSGSLLSRYETGISAVSDEGAEKIAEVLSMDIIEVRRGLGLWVPPEPADSNEDDLPPINPTDEQLAEMIEDARGDRILYEALMSVWRLRNVGRQLPKPDSVRDRSADTA